LTEQQILEAQARVLYYELWNYNLKVEDFKPGTQYQRLASCSITKIEGGGTMRSSPSWVDTVVEPYAPDNIYWVKYIEEAIREKKVRMRNPMSTERIKEFLKWVYLSSILVSLMYLSVGKAIYQTRSMNAWYDMKIHFLQWYM
jgi:hypothetical protein